MTKQKKRSRVAHADHRISSKVNGQRDSRVMRMLGAASEIGDQPQMRLLCAGTIALAIARRDKRLAATGLKMLAAHTLATWGKSGVKAVINRTRPESGDDPKVRLGSSEDHAENSFPSGHSAGAVSVAEAFARDYPRHAVAARLAAVAVSAIQVPRGAHYAGDVAVGMIIGLAAERSGNAVVHAVSSRTDDRTPSGAYGPSERDVLP